MRKNENITIKDIDKLQHLAAIVDSSDDAIISKSLDGQITSWNKGAERLFGYEAHEVIGQPISLLMPTERKDDFPYIMDRLKKGLRVDHFETERITKDGKRLHVSITVSPIRDVDGQIVGASKIARDVTEKYELTKRREEFVSIASHELKTPITSQKAFGQMLEKLIDDNGYAELAPYIKKINKQTDKLAKLVEDLLVLSRAQQGKLNMEDNVFSFDDLVGNIIEEVQMGTSHRIMNIGKTNKNIRGDQERLGQVLTNLIFNAIKYSPRAKRVIVNSKLIDEKVLFSVKDYGIGIHKDYFEKIFEPFFRVDNAVEKTFPGMGIGLHVSNNIVALHGGKIWTESIPGKSSTFYVELPYVN